MTTFEICIAVWVACSAIVLMYVGVELYKHGWAGYVEQQRIDQDVEYMNPRGILWGIVIVTVFAPIVLPVIIIQLLLK